jgi:hypothetical protein
MLFRLVNCGGPTTCGSGGSGQLRIKVPSHFRPSVLFTTDRWPAAVFAWWVIPGGSGPGNNNPAPRPSKAEDASAGFRVRREQPSANARGFRGLVLHNPEGACRHLLTKLSESGAGDEVLMSIAGHVALALLPRPGWTRNGAPSTRSLHASARPASGQPRRQIPNQREQRICATLHRVVLSNSQEIKLRC